MRIQSFDYSVDLLQALLWQYNEATAIQSLVGDKQDWYNMEQSDFWSEWYDDVFNLVTADTFGLSVWCIVLGVPYFVNYSPVDVGEVWGFDDDDFTSGNQNFENGNFADAANGRIVLSLDEQRFLLRLRYFQLTTRGDINSINLFLNYLFTDSACPYTGTMWVLDGLDMTMTYVLNCDMSDAMRQVLVQYDLLPRPAAVGLKVVDLTQPVWGFGEDNQNFENGTFVEDFS
jgi:hypothetical protein